MDSGKIKADVSWVNEFVSKLDHSLDKIPEKALKKRVYIDNSNIILSNIRQRIQSISASIELTAQEAIPEIEQAVHTFRDWMINGSIVRVIGAGRAKLAGSIPANRLAHGGARVYIQDDIIPMPHSMKGGGIIAVSASGRTASVLDVLKHIRKKSAKITVIGIADHKASQFENLCDIFIGIRLTNLRNPLQALADMEEYVISMLLDAMVVYAGKLAGFDETTWRLGHENIGPTGPYDADAQSDIDLDVGFGPLKERWSSKG